MGKMKTISIKKKELVWSHLSSYTFDFPTLSKPSVSRYNTDTFTPSITSSTGVPQTHIPVGDCVSFIVYILKFCQKEINWYKNSNKCTRTSSTYDTHIIESYKGINNL